MLRYRNFMGRPLRVFVGILVAVLISAFAPTAGAADFTVNSNVDNEDGSCPQNCTLRAAINAVNAGLGESIDFNPADFPTENTLEIVLTSELPAITRSGTKINGSGAGVMIDGSLLKAGEDGLIFESGVGSTLSEVKVLSIGVRNFLGNGIVVCGGTRPNCSDPVSQIRVARVTATGNKLSGIRIAGSDIDQPTVSNSYAEGNNSGILITATRKLKEAQVSNCTAIDNTTTGIHISSDGNNRDAKLTNNTVGGNDSYGMHVTTENKTINLQVTGNTSFDNGFAGIAVYASGNVKKPQISDNYAIGNENGIYIQSSLGMVVEAELLGNRAVNNGLSGILLVEGSNNLVKNNVVSDNLNGIKLYGPGQNNKIKGNRTRGNQETGILVGSESTDSQIKENEARGNGTDLVDENADCDENTWRYNRFVTGNRACIK